MKSSPVGAVRERAPLAEAAVTDGSAARAAAAATGATATTATTAAPASAATAAPGHLLRTCAALFLVEEMESGERDVGDFFFTEQDALGRREIEFLCGVRSRYSCCRSATRERKCQSGSAKCRNCGFGHTLPLRSLLHWHSRILQPVRPVFRFQPERSYAEGEDRARLSISVTR